MVNCEGKETDYSAAFRSIDSRGMAPVYGSEEIVGNAKQLTADAEAGPVLTGNDESLAQTAENERTPDFDDAAEKDSSEDTDAVPETVTEATDSSSGTESASDAEKRKDDSASEKKEGTDSLTDSIPADSSAADLLKKQENLVGSTYTSAVPVDGKTYYIRCASNKNFALTVKDSSTANGADIIIK